MRSKIAERAAELTPMTFRLCLIRLLVETRNESKTDDAEMVFSSLF